MHMKKRDHKVAIFILILFLIGAAAVGYLWDTTTMNQDVVGGATSGEQDKTGSKDSFKFVVIADIPSSMNSINPPQHTTTAITSIQSLQSPQPELVIINGNMISGLSNGNAHLNDKNNQGIIQNKWDAFYQQIYQPLATKGLVAPVAGSLDTLLQNPSLLMLAYQLFWQRYKPAINIKGNYPFTYSFDYKNSHFVVLNTADATIIHDQITWLEQDLSSAKKENIFVFSHVPPEQFCADPACSFLQGTGKQRLFQIMKKYKVNIFFTGNNHVYYKARYQGVNVVASGAIGGTFDIISTDQEKYKQNPSYVVVDVQGNDIRVGAITGNLGSSFNNGFTESLLPQTMPGYDQYTELTKNPIQIIPTVIPSSSSAITARASSGNPQMDQWDQLILDACKTEQNQKECFALVKSVMYVESGGNQNAGEKKGGCLGLMQFCKIAAIDKRFKEFFDQSTIGTPNDDRLKPEKSIRAGKKFIIDMLRKEMQIDNIFIMYIGYNVGSSYGKKANDYFEGKNPTQAEVEAWLDQTDLSKEKINEPKTAFPKLIKKYLEYLNQGVNGVSYPSGYKSVYGASDLQKINAPSAISYYITPSFTIVQEFAGNSLAIYSQLREYIRWYVKNTESCTNTGKPLDSCSKESIASLNKEPYFAANIGVLDDCTNQESDLEKFFYDFAEEIKSCLKNGNDRMCGITLKQPPQPPATDGKYRIVFKQENENIIMEFLYNNQPLTSFSHNLQEQFNKRGIMISDSQNLDGSKESINEFYITFEALNNEVVPFIYYKVQAGEKLQGVTTNTLYLMPDHEQNIIVLNPVVGNTQAVYAEIIPEAAALTQNTKKLCITSISQKPFNYFEAINPLQIRSLQYELAVRFDNTLKSIENFVEPMPTFLDLKSTELTLEQLQVSLKNKKIAILSDALAIAGQNNNGFITQLKKSLSAGSFSIYAKDASAQWLKDNYFQQQIISQSFDILIIAIGSKDVCDAVGFRNLITSVDTMVSQFKASNQENNVIVVGLPSSENEVCNNNILTYHAFINKNDLNNKQAIAELEDKLGKKLSASKAITVGLDIYPETSLEKQGLRYKYYQTTIDKRKNMPRKKVSEVELHTIIAQKIIDALRGLENNIDRLSCKNVFAVGTSSTAWALKNDGYIVRLRKQYPDIVFDGMGYKSESSKDVAEHFEAEVLPTITGKVDCLIVAAGLNDIGNLENVKKNLAHIYDLAHKNDMKVIAMELQPYFQKAQNPQAYENVHALHQWFGSDADVDAVIKIYDLMNDPEHEGRMQLKYISGTNTQPDFLHYNYEEGHKLVAEQIAKVIS